MSDVVDSMEGDDFVCGYVLSADGAQTVKGTMVATGSGGVVFIEPGVGIVQGVLLAADEIDCAVGISLEGCAEIQNKAMQILIQDIKANEHN